MPKIERDDRALRVRAMRAKHSANSRGALSTAIASESVEHVIATLGAQEVKARDKKFSLLRVQLSKKYKGEVFTTIANGTRETNISAIRSGWQELDDLVTGETDKDARTIAGTGLGWPRGRIIEIYGEEGMGKALEISTPVLTSNGFMPIGHLRKGDYVVGSDGHPTRVVGVFPQGTKSGFRVTATDGGSLICCAEHLWQTTKVGQKQPEVRTTAEIQRTLTRKVSGDCAPEDGRYPMHRLPLVAPIHFAGRGSLPLAPYLLGCLIGDGSLQGSCVVIHKPELDVLLRCDGLLPAIDAGVLFDGGNGSKSALRIKRRNRNGEASITTLALQELGLHGKKSIDKFVPEDYLFASVDDRLELLRGLLDTDGWVRDSGTDVEFSTSSQQLAEDVMFLARSLGAIVSCNVRTPHYTYRGRKMTGAESHRITIRFVDDTCPVSSDKHRKKWVGGDKTPKYRSIESVEPVGDAEFVCIKVEAEDGLFVTEDFILTHNTTQTLHIIAAFQKAGELCAFVDAEHSLDVSYAAKLGVDLKTLIFNQPDRGGEQALDIVHSLAESGTFGCIVVDSVAALTPLAELELDFEDNSQPGQHAKLMSRMLRKLVSVCRKTNTLLVFINQTRLKIGVRFGNPKTTTGGQALKFYASIRLEMVNVKTQKKSGRVVFRRTRIRTVKNKCAPPFRDVYADIAPSRGIIAVHGESDFDGGSEDDD